MGPHGRATSMGRATCVGATRAPGSDSRGGDDSHPHGNTRDVNRRSVLARRADEGLPEGSSSVRGVGG
jgi:hypothetical protein